MTQGELGKLAYEEFVARGGWMVFGAGTLLSSTWEELNDYSKQVWMMVGAKVCIETQRDLAKQGRLPKG